MNLTDLATYIFLLCNFLVLLPVTLVGWDVYVARKYNSNNSDKDASVLAYVILQITTAVLIFHVAQFISVLLGKLGYNIQARIPIILLIDGSLIFLTMVYIYAYFRIRRIRNRIERELK